MKKYIFFLKKHFKKFASHYYFGFVIGFSCILFFMFVNNFWQKKVHIVVFPGQIFFPQVKTTPTSYDTMSDNSITKYVDANTPFNDKGYIPENMVFLQSDFVADAKGGQKLRQEANDALQRMARDFYQKFGKKIFVVSAYRSYAYQVGIKNGGCADNFCAKAGFSEHQSGLAVDLWEATNEKDFFSKDSLKAYFEWMSQNAYLYGFQNTYQKGRFIDTYEKEPWHWRYVGKNFASLLKIQEKDFAEYYYSIK